MSPPDPLARLRRFVPLLAIIIVVQAAGLIFVLLAGKAPRLWPLVVVDLLFSGILLFVLWRRLVRRPR